MNNDPTISYDPQADAMYITFSKNDIIETDQMNESIIVDYDKAWDIIWIEIIAVSKNQNLVQSLLFKSSLFSPWHRSSPSTFLQEWQKEVYA
jgi:uncharacterized protein YuzE